MLSCEKIAKVLRADKDNLEDLEVLLSEVTGKSGVLEDICRQNGEIINNRLSELAIDRPGLKAGEVYQALINKIKSDDEFLFAALKNPDISCSDGCSLVLSEINKQFGGFSGWFLKKDKFLEVLEKEPPQKVISALGYSNFAEMMKKEDWREVAAAIRFVEGGEWISSTFFKAYQNISPNDFEERKIDIISLSDKWGKLAENFVSKKYHNISHLKEIGLIFIMPAKISVPGELVRTLSLLFHYLNEVIFYSDLFRKLSGNKNDFREEIVSLLRGDIIESRENLQRGDWLIIQRYLAKEDENDWRLFEPHVNPESIHWERAEKMLVDFSMKVSGDNRLDFWRGLNWVGEYYPTETGVDVLVSFNIVDTSMSLVKEKEMIKYLYHHQESLWNKLFSSYFGEKYLEDKIKENILKGKINFDQIKSA